MTASSRVIILTGPSTMEEDQLQKIEYELADAIWYESYGHLQAVIDSVPDQLLNHSPFIIADINGQRFKLRAHTARPRAYLETDADLVLNPDHELAKAIVRLFCRRNTLRQQSLAMRKNQQDLSTNTHAPHTVSSLH